MGMNLSGWALRCVLCPAGDSECLFELKYWERSQWSCPVAPCFDVLSPSGDNLHGTHINPTTATKPRQAVTPPCQQLLGVPASAEDVYQGTAGKD